MPLILNTYLVNYLLFKSCLLGFALLLRASAIQARLALPCFVTTRDSPSKAWPLRSLFQSLMALGLASLGRFSTSRTVSFCFSLTYIARYARV